MPCEHNSHRTNNGVKRAALAFTSKPEAGLYGFEEDLNIPTSGIE
jgi:hypothetical protein